MSIKWQETRFSITPHSRLLGITSGPQKNPLHFHQTANVPSEDAPPGTDSTTTTIIVPSIGKEDAEKAMKSIALPKEPKKQSQYVRFKSIMLKDAKARDDKETVKGITAAAKGAWNMVKHRSVQVEPLGSSITGPTPSESNSERFLS